MLIRPMIRRASGGFSIRFAHKSTTASGPVYATEEEARSELARQLRDRLEQGDTVVGHGALYTDLDTADAAARAVPVTS